MREGTLIAILTLMLVVVNFWAGYTSGFQEGQRQSKAKRFVDPPTMPMADDDCCCGSRCECWFQEAAKKRK